MKSILKYTLPAFAIAGLLSSCEPELDAPGASAGNANFSKYNAYGNSLTAGYGNGGIYRESQLNSFPSILAQQFKLAGGGDFKQPLFSEAQKNGTGYVKLTGFTNAGSPILTPVTTELAYRGGTTLGGDPLLTKYLEPINNYGVPGLSVFASTMPTYSGLNNHFERITAAAGTVSYLEMVSASDPTFFTFWLGNIDVLGYATSGGVPSNAFQAITDTAIFRDRYNKLIDAATIKNAKGVLATIPDVTAIPFFTTVTVPRVSAAAGGAKVYIRTGLNDTREATPDDLILLSTQTGIGDTTGGVPPHGFHPANPLTNKEVLDKDEVKMVRDATMAFNETIRRTGLRKDLPVADMNGFLTTLNQGPLFSYGVANTSSYITGNVFALDGVHLTPRGNAFVANEFIRVINTKYGSNIPQVNPNNYEGIRLP